jgi:hypothetical protein
MFFPSVSYAPADERRLPGCDVVYKIKLIFLQGADMQVIKSLFQFIVGAFLAASLLQFAGCSSTNDAATSAGNSAAANNTNTATTGQVSLLLTDKPSEDFDQINITVNSWQLLGDGNPVVLSDTVATFNLLDLRNSFDVVVGAVDVPVGTYSKIRLDVAKVELVKLENGVVTQTEVAKLPSGKIDFVFSGNVVVAPNSTLTLKIDMDADNSIQYHATGNDKYIFRPVVKIDVVADAADALIRLSGVVFDKQATPDPERFTLCNAGAISVTPDCTSIHVETTTTFLDQDMLPADYVAFSNGDEVMLFGRFDSYTGAVDAIRVLQQSYDTDNNARLLALMVNFTGPVVAGKAPLVTTTDSLHVPASMALDSDLTNALIANQQGVILGDTAIDAGVGAKVFGILQPNNAAPTEIRAGFVILNPLVTP